MYNKPKKKGLILLVIFAMLAGFLPLNIAPVYADTAALTLVADAYYAGSDMYGTRDFMENSLNWVGSYESKGFGDAKTAIRFDISGINSIVGVVSSINLRIYVTAVIGNPILSICSADSDLLDESDSYTFPSTTGATLFPNETISSAGWKQYDITSFIIGKVPSGNSEATIMLTGDAFGNTGDNCISIASDEDIPNAPQLIVTYTPPTPQASISTASTINEGNLDAASVDIKLANDTFKDETLDEANFALENAPSGCTVDSVSYTDPAKCTVNLAFDGTDFDSDISNFKVTVGGTETTSGSSLTSTNALTITVNTSPTVSTTDPVAAIASTAATAGGTISSDGGSDITARGVEYKKTSDTAYTVLPEGGTDTGAFSVALAGLTASTSYDVRAYATNSEGTSYGDKVTFKTADPPNAPPTISDIADQTTDEDTPVGPIAITVGDSGDNSTAVENLTLEATTNNTTLLPGTSFAFGGSGADRTLTITPAANQSGTATVTVTVKDHLNATAQDTFNLTVNPVNDPPTLNPMSSYSIDEDAGLQTINLSGISDGDGEIQDITVTAVSSNTSVIPDPTVNYVSPAATGSLTFTPEADASGVATITVTVTDNGTGTNSVQKQFTVTVKSVNDAPTISDIKDKTTNEDMATSAISFAIGDVETAASNLVVTASSSDTSILPNSGIVLSGTDAARTITLTPSPNANGTVTVTVKVKDEGNLESTDTFTLTINPINDLPTVTSFVKSVDEDNALAFTVDDFTIHYSDNDGSTLTKVKITGVPSNGSLKLGDSPVGLDSEITSAQLASLKYVPTANWNGSDSFTWQGFDGTVYSDDSTVTITVNTINDAPTISDIKDKTTNEDTATSAISFAIGDVETVASNLVVTASSSDTSILPDSGIVLSGTGTARAITLTPVPNANGTVTVTVKVKDEGNLESTDIFILTVNAINDLPTVTGFDKTINEDTELALTQDDFTAHYQDAETNAMTKVKITAIPSHGALKLGETSVKLNDEIGAVNLCTLKYVPAADYNGSDSFKWQGFDGTAYSGDSTVTITINTINDAPTISDITDKTTNEDTAASAVSFTIGDIETAASNLVVTASSSDTSILPDSGIVLSGTGTARALTLTPAPNANGTVTVTVKVKDEGSLESTDSFILTINPVNDIPVISDITLSTKHDTTVAFSVADFTSKYTDAEGSVLAKVQIVTLPDSKLGTLKLDNNGTPADITAGQEITAAELGNIRFVPAAGVVSAAAEFLWKASDSTAYSAPAKAVINIADFNTNALLNTLEITGITLSPAFNSNITAYTGQASYSTSNAVINISAEDSNASVKVNSAAVVGSTATAALQTGSNTILVEVTAEDGVTKKTYTITITKAAAPSKESDDHNSSNSSTRTTETTTPAAASTVQPGSGSNMQAVLINGVPQQNSVTITSPQTGKASTVTADVSDEAVKAKLETEGKNAVVTVVVKNNADAVVCKLGGDTVKTMEDNSSVLEVVTEMASYKIPAKQINLAEAAKQLGENVAPEDIQVNVEIKAASQEVVKVVENDAKKNEYSIVVPPIDFSVTCKNDKKSVAVDRFDIYVERTVPIPEGVDPNKITTAVVLNNDGTVRHVPTKITIINGKYYAQINSLTNSTYSLIWHPITFKDMAAHWAKDYVNEMGSRMVVTGVDDKNYSPDGPVTRAEFAAIVSRALGIKELNDKNTFNDVAKEAWYYKYVLSASQYGIISGYEDGTFRPDKLITREEATAIISRAMKAAGMNAKMNNSDTSKLLAEFKDNNTIGSWAKEYAAICVSNEVFSGDHGFINPKSNLTRAESAVIVMRMLQKAGLI